MPRAWRTWTPQIKVLRIPLILLGPILTSASPKDDLTFELYHYPSALGCGKTCSKSFYSGGAARSDCCAVKEYVAKSGSDKRSIKTLKCPEGLADIFHVEAGLGDDASIVQKAATLMKKLVQVVRLGVSPYVVTQEYPSNYDGWMERYASAESVMDKSMDVGRIVGDATI
jgi:hypothetical protein